MVPKREKGSQAIVHLISIRVNYNVAGSTAKSRDRQRPQQIGIERRQIRTNLGLNQRFFGHNKAKAGGPNWFDFFSRLSVDLPCGGSLPATYSPIGRGRQ